MKKIAVTILAVSNVSFAFAGGILTNTNQSARFARLMSLDAATTIDAAYYNPAGLVKLKDGMHFSISNQSAFQTREITSTFAPFVLNGGSDTKFFKGTASAPIIPSIQAAYKKDKWVLSANICVIGGGGKATFNNGLPSFEAQTSMLPKTLDGAMEKAFASMPGATYQTKAYSADQYMAGSSFIYGAQAGGSYKINEMFSAYGGLRLNIVNNKYEGHLKNVMINPNSNVPGFGTGQMVNAHSYFTALSTNAGVPPALQAGMAQFAAGTADKQLDSSQSGWGITPIVGVNFSVDKLNVGLKYEFKASLDIENKTKIDDTDSFEDGVNTPHDIPALFTIGASYKIVPKLTANIGYHHFFDSDAKMKDDKQKHTGEGTNEYSAGLEFKINDMFLVSGGTQFTTYGVKDGFQSDLSFSVNSYAIGFGGAANVSKNVQINAGYFWSDYANYTKKSDDYYGRGLAGTDVFTRTNKVFAVGVEFSF